ncbi:MAG: flagellar hook-length control protein FliK [Rhodobacteraceae bacterium]|nr:flagellar hook-length control protein FliK [Paracoccaceae bacterium]
MTATPLIKDQSVVAVPFSGGVKADAGTVGGVVFADIFAAIDMAGLRGSDHAGVTPVGLPLVRATGVEEPASGDPAMDDVALFAKMMQRAKAALVAPEAGDPSDIPQVADMPILDVADGHLAVLRLIGAPAATDMPVDLEQVAAFLAQLLNGDSSKAAFALPDAMADDASLETALSPDAGGDLLAAAGFEMALMQVDGHLAIMFAGGRARLSGEVVAYPQVNGQAAPVPQQAKAQAAPLVSSGDALAVRTLASPVVTATMTMSLPEGHPLKVLGQVGTASAHAKVSLGKTLVPVAMPDLAGSVDGQKIDATTAKTVENLTVKPDSLSVTSVSDGSVARIAGSAPGAGVAAPGGDALPDGTTFQPALPEAGSKPVGTLASLAGLPAGPADQGAAQIAPVVPTADRDLMYLDIARSNVVSAVPPMVAASSKSGRMRGGEQADGPQGDQRAGLVTQILPGSEILGVRTTDTARANVTRIARGDVPALAEINQKPALAPDHKAAAQAASDMAGPPSAQSGTPTPTGSSGAASPVPMAQSSGLPAMLDVRRQGWTQTLVQRAAGMVQSGGVLTLKILPQHLGQITLKMSEGRRGLDLRIVTEVASTAAMLRGVESQISSAFEGAGLALGEFSANSGKGGGTAFGDDGDDGEPALAGEADADETDADTVSNDTAQHSLLNIIL